MKKFVCAFLALIMMMALCACGGKTAPAETEAVAGGPGSALEVLETVWGLYAEDEKFSIYGGNPKENFEENVWDAPGTYDLADENMSFNLLIPADQIPNVDDVASMTHGMMANNFNSAVFHLKSGVDAKAFADALYQSISGNMWICGMPDRAIVATVGDYVVMAYGVGEAMTSFETHLAEAYPAADILYNESLV